MYSFAVRKYLCHVYLYDLIWNQEKRTNGLEIWININDNVAYKKYKYEYNT